MKKLFTILVPIVIGILLTASVFAQTPQKMSYQAVIRNNSEDLVTNQSIGMQISILQDSESGSAVYVETQTPTTNANGLVSLEIGAGTVQSGNFATINWAGGAYFIKTETDLTGGTSYTITGTSQLLSVPFALHTNEVDPSVPQGTQAGEMQYWNGTEWIIVAPGNEDDIMTFINNTPTWFTDTTEWPGAPTTAAATNITAESFDANWTASEGATFYYLDVNTLADFTGTWIHNDYIVGDHLSYTISGLTCATSYSYRLRASNSSGTSVNSNVITLETSECGDVSTVTNPTTGRIWMDRNLGALQVATSSTDADAYGDLYQWGRLTDGHEKRISTTLNYRSGSDIPGHGYFIIYAGPPFDWRNPQNENLWQGVNGINNPCPSGYRLPTKAELDAERLSWYRNTSDGAFASPLKFTVAGDRTMSGLLANNAGSVGLYWSSTINNIESSYQLTFSLTSAGINNANRIRGLSVRCIKD